MMMGSPEVRDILLSSDDSREVIRRIHARFREEHPRMSLANIARRLRISARGNLSEIMRGKRLLPMAHRWEIGEVFQLSAAHARFLALLIERDHAKPASASRSRLARELRSLRKALTAEVLDKGSPPLTDDPLVFELIAVFGLFGNSVTREDLMGYFGRKASSRIDRLLERLEERGWIGREGGSYRLLKLSGYLSGPEYRKINQEFISAGLADAAERLPKLYGRPEEALFRSCFVSVRGESFSGGLVRLRELMDEWEASVETEDADRLVRVSLQVYPASRPAPGAGSSS